MTPAGIGVAQRLGRLELYLVAAAHDPITWCRAATILVTLVGVLSRLPDTIGEAIAAASILVGYPLVYLIYEWVYHYALDPRPKNH